MCYQFEQDITLVIIITYKYARSILSHAYNRMHIMHKIAYFILRFLMMSTLREIYVIGTICSHYRFYLVVAMQMSLMSETAIP